MNIPNLINANSLYIPLADGSVQMVATSPPYFSLRDYGTGKWDGGNPECDHVMKNARNDATDKGIRAGRAEPEKIQYKNTCKKCGAVRVDSQIGQETHPAAYVENLVKVFRELWRVLRNDGLVWLNLGDSYNGSGGAGGDYAEGGLKEGQPKYKGARVDGLKPKDLIGIPWRVAFALQEDGWYLRSDVIWSKPNPMPESVTDRPTKAHEYIFLLTKSARYFYDAEAVKEDAQPDATVRDRDTTKLNNTPGRSKMMGLKTNHYEKRNRRSVWDVATSPYNGAHFATWPPALVEPMIKAGSKPGDMVLDPFAGSGTTGLVARQLGRRFVGLDLSFAYLKECARSRLSLDALQAWEHGLAVGTNGYHELPMFNFTVERTPEHAAKLAAAREAGAGWTPGQPIPF